MKLYDFKSESLIVTSTPWIDRIVQAHEALRVARASSYQHKYSFVNAPFDACALDTVLALAHKKISLDPRMLIIVGIGGSNLGTKAIHDFLHGIYYNDTDPVISCYFVDTLDINAVTVILDRMKHILSQGNQVLINVISKSGKTTETILNFNLFLTILKQYRPETYHQYVVITTDEHSELHTIALQEKFSLLTVPHNIGGRYSVFTAVSLFPLAILGVDVRTLCTGAQHVITDVLLTVNNDAAQGAYNSYDQCLQKKNIHDMFVFGSELVSFGLWCRQLLGESLGKDKNQGITPTVSVGSTDLHSIGQLYLGGPYDKYVTFVTLKSDVDYNVDVQSELQSCLPSLKEHSIQFVMNAIIQGTQKAFTIDNRSFESLHVLERTVKSIGQLMQWYMMRVVYMAHLLEVNPFDQPHVELYKHETRKIITAE